MDEKIYHTLQIGDYLEDSTSDLINLLEEIKHLPLVDDGVSNDGYHELI